MSALGKKTWVIPDGYLPQKSSGGMTSHESVCVLNLGNDTAQISIEIYFEDKPPMTGLVAECEGKRTNHIRMEQIKDASGKLIPHGVPYAIKVTSSRPVVVQHTRLDTTQAELSLMTTMGYGL
ncbi:MAG: hypothetical protein EHM28_04425 [Spirochaetaceae bacterium]|nr:MAG: hypothetical protein EHM28_04425 [Spirochaetaceae bacterium]